MTYTVPDGWSGNTGGSSTFGSTGVRDGSHGLQIIRNGDPQNLNAFQTLVDPNQASGWFLDHDVLLCADGKRPVSRLTDKSFVAIDRHEAYYREYTVSCSDGSHRTFAPRLWWLPTSQVLFIDDDGGFDGTTSDTQSQRQTMDDIIASVDLSTISPAR